MTESARCCRRIVVTSQEILAICKYSVTVENHMPQSHQWTRRRFLQQVGWTAGLMPSLALAAPAAKSTAVSFGFTLYGMRSLPVAEALRLCSGIGYDSVELACMPDWPSAPESLSATIRMELRKQLADAKLVVSSLMENVSPLSEESVHRANVDRLKRACELACDLAPQSPPVIETVLGGKPAEWDQVREKMVVRLGDWARIAEAAKVVIALKPHVAGALHTPTGAAWLMEQLKSPWLRLAYDYSHFELQDIPLKPSLEAMLPQTVFIHVKDTTGTAARFQFLLPGDGHTDYATYFQQLKSAGYGGPLVVEVSGQIHTKPGYDPIAAARRCYANMAPILDQSGLRKLARS